MADDVDWPRKPIGPQTPEWELYRSADPANGDLGRMGAAKEELARRGREREDELLDKQLAVARAAAAAAIKQLAVARAAAAAAIAAAIAAVFSALIALITLF